MMDCGTTRREPGPGRDAARRSDGQGRTAALLKETALFRWLDRRGVAIPLARLSREIVSSPMAALGRLAREASAPHAPARSIAVFALPKSGSSMTQCALQSVGLVDLGRSVLTRTRNTDPELPADANLRRVFRWARADQACFVKTHLEWHPGIPGALEEIGAVGLVQVRDIRDALISRYHHVMADPRHRHHALLRSLPLREGIKRSFFGQHPGGGDDPIRHFADWITGWVSSRCLPVIRYEDFLVNPQDFLEGLCERIGKPASEAGRMAAAIADDRAEASRRSLAWRLRKRGGHLSTFRSGRSAQWREVLDDEAISLVKLHANAALVACGYELDDRW